MWTISRRPLHLSFAASILIAALSMPAAQADILDDILGTTTAARDRATEARNNAASARDRATEARNYALTARDNAAAARDTALLLRNNMQAGIDALSDSIEEAIMEAVADLEREMAAEIAGRDAFVNGGAGEPFRETLIALLANAQAMLNALNDASGMPDAQIDFERETTLIEALPLRALYPLYRALVAEAPGVLDRFVELLGSAAADIEVIKGLLLFSPEPVDGDLLDEELSACAYAIEHRAALKTASGNLTNFATIAKSVAALLKAAGTTEVHKTGAVWGWVGVSLKSNRIKKVGEFVDGIGKAVGGLNDSISARLRHCTAISVAADARDRDHKILENQELILRYLKVADTHNRP